MKNSHGFLREPFFYYFDNTFPKESILNSVYKSIGGENTALFYTLNLNKTLEREIEIIYNDDLNNANNNYAHMKGALYCHGDQGIFLVHTAPKFFDFFFENGTFNYPTNGKLNGQNFICITINEAALKTIINHLFNAKPRIYKGSYHIAKTLSQQWPTLRSIKKGRFETTAESIEKFKFFLEMDGVSEEFVIMSKNHYLRIQAYEELPKQFEDKTFWAVHWWRKGEGIFNNQQLKNIGKINTRNRGIYWYHYNDHSKYSISTDGKVICFSDLNFVATQKKRGGGFYCMYNQKLIHAIKKRFTFHVAQHG